MPIILSHGFRLKGNAMSVKEQVTTRARKPAKTGQSGSLIQAAIHTAIRDGYVVGCEVRVGHIPGMIVGYNIGRFGRFAGNIYPLLVSTALGVTKCTPGELTRV
jgi:hypothetical protein